MCSEFTLVIGGAASGKSAYAENLVTAAPGPWVYLATGQAFDDEMRAKIDIHQSRRGTGWHTIEAPLDLAGVLADIDAGMVLVDCMTFWLSNQLLAEHDLAAQTARLMPALEACAVPVVAVTNEVGQGVVPEHALGRQFREAQGRLNIALAARADRVIQVVAGLPNLLKGAS